MTRSGDNGDSSPCFKTSMMLSKGATFHSPTSSGSSIPTFQPPRLPRSQSHLDDVVDANRRRIAMTLCEIDEALSKTESLSLYPKQSEQDILHDTSLPVPRGFLGPHNAASAMSKVNQRRVLRPRSVRRPDHHASDSGLGSSIISSKSETKTQSSAAAITRSAASCTMAARPSLGPRAVNRIHEHTLGPLLEKSNLKNFEPIVLDIPRRIRSKEIICLRDVEKTLLFRAPVSQLLTDCGVWGNAYRNLLVKEKAESAAMYLDFCFTSIRCIQATVEYLSDREQIRAGDRPYTNGYFIDLKEQLFQYGRELAAAKGGDITDGMQLDQYVTRFVPLSISANNPSRNDEIKLIGGIAENGHPVELVRIQKDGTAISLATGKPVDIGAAPTQVKRSLSEIREDEEEIMRSMARRKKNATPEELAPKKCREHGCSKEFKRPCDLTKHEKTHSRPWKCPHTTCKYHEFGWPTEKEMDRHVNDKHSDAPAMYECHYKPCPYKSKRESNCKQHMEKAHGWTYIRTKTNGGKKQLSNTINSANSIQQTPPLGNVSTPSDAYSVPTPPRDNAPPAMTNDFPLYPPDADWLASYGVQPETLDAMDLTLEHTSPSSAASYEQYPPYQNGSQFITEEDIYAATARIPAHQLPVNAEYGMYNKAMPSLQMPPQQPLAPLQPQRHHQYQLPMSSMQAYQAPQLFNPPPHFSPSGQQNAMLYTPPSQNEIEDGFDETYGDGTDFQLFPTSMNKGHSSQSLFGDMPSANLGYSQVSQSELFQQMDLSQFDYHNFQE